MNAKLKSKFLAEDIIETQSEINLYTQGEIHSFDINNSSQAEEYDSKTGLKFWETGVSPDCSFSNLREGMLGGIEMFFGMILRNFEDCSSRVFAYEVGTYNDLSARWRANQYYTFEIMSQSWNTE